MAEAFDYFNEIWVTEWEETASDASDPPHKLLTLLRLGAFEFEAWREVQWRIWVEFWSLGDRDPKFRDQYERIYARFRSPFLGTIREGVATNQFTTASAEDAADRLTALIDGLRIHAMLEPHRMPRERMFTLLVEAAQHELGFEVDDLPGESSRRRRPADCTHASGRPPHRLGSQGGRCRHLPTCSACRALSRRARTAERSPPSGLVGTGSR